MEMADSEKPTQVAPDKSRRQTRRRMLMLCAVVLLCLAPFLSKPFHIDDPLFVWAAQRIVQDPSDPYGFDVNWYGSAQPMSYVTKNPPLSSYCLAVAGRLFGWSELSLHAAMLIPAMLVIAGTFLLATRLCGRPTEAALLALLSPVFLVSATGVMCDVMMLAIWVWAVFFWMRGIDDNKHGFLIASTALAALCPLTKYFGIALVPLLLIYGIVKKRGIGVWVAYLAVPVASLVAYCLYTTDLYDRNLLTDAVSFASGNRQEMRPSVIVVLGFTGGCLAGALFYAERLWSRKALLGWIALAVVAVAGISVIKPVPGTSPLFEAQFRWLVSLQFGVMLAVGVSVLVLSILDVVRRRNAESILLVAWAVGTFFFAGFVNWTVNGRSILPMVPPLAILMMRRIDARVRAGDRGALPAPVIPLVLIGLLSFSAAFADLTEAMAGKKAARAVCGRYLSGGRDLWFAGHWGFQYYMQQLGATPVDAEFTVLPEGANVVIPKGNTNIVKAPESIVLKEVIRIRVLPFISTMSEPSGAGFYSSTFGPLPYVVGLQLPDIYGVVRMTEQTQFTGEVSD